MAVMVALFAGGFIGAALGVLAMALVVSGRECRGCVEDVVAPYKVEPR